MKKNITVSAPGKLMLFGEHSVVYGYPCLATAVGERMQATIETIPESQFVLDAPDINISKYTKPIKDLGKGDIPGCVRFVEIAVHNFHSKNPLQSGIHISTSSTFSHEFGFGTSSASTVCTIKALSQITGQNLDNKQMFDLAYKTILDVQKKGSGFDVAVSVYGGTIYYSQSGKHIEQIPFAIGRDAVFIVGYTGVKADTCSLVRQVAEKKEKYPEKVERIFTAITKLVEDAKIALINHDWDRLGTYMNFNQEYLRDLGVSTEKLETLISAAKSEGAYGAKLSGAGGGDCMIAIAPVHKKEAVEKAIQTAGGIVIPVCPNAEGVRTETSDDPKEQFIVVDEMDNVLDYKTRHACHHDAHLIHRVIGVHIFNTNGDILLQKRSSTKDLGAGLWGSSCAGHVLKGETYENAAKRELLEELGVSHEIAPVKKIIVRDKEETEMAMIYTATSDGPFHPDPQEVDEVRFFTKDQILHGMLKGTLRLTNCTIESLKAIHYL